MVLYQSSLTTDDMGMDEFDSYDEALAYYHSVLALGYYDSIRLVSYNVIKE